MELLYVHEHLSCKNYVSDFHIGFNCKEMKADEFLHLDDKYFNYMIFIMDGELLVSYNEFKNHLCCGGEMLFVAQNSNFTGEALTDIKYIILSFDNQFTLCDQLSLDSLQPYHRDRPIFNKLDIREPVYMVLNTVQFYMKHKIQCKHLHADKQQEVFLMLRSFYTKKELACFLSPILNKDVDFKAFVLNNYQEVKTVEELAKLCNSSVRSLTRKFRIYFGDSPYSWMLKQRSLHIRNRLSDPKIPISQIVKEFGFSSPAHFTSYCKKYFGDSPSRIRKEVNKAESQAS